MTILQGLLSELEQNCFDVRETLALIQEAARTEQHRQIYDEIKKAHVHLQNAMLLSK